MKIGELARATQTPTETIRFYEHEGLLPTPGRTDANYRIYGPEHRQRLVLIRRCRSLDMSLDEIRVLLQVWDGQSEQCGEVNDLLDEHIHHVSARIRELEDLRQDLLGLRARCSTPAGVQSCGILQGLLEERPSMAPSGSHIGAAHGRHR